MTKKKKSAVKSEESFRKKVVDFLEENDISQTDFARMLGMNVTTVHRFVRSKGWDDNRAPPRITLDLAYKICGVLEIEPAEVLG